LIEDITIDNGDLYAIYANGLSVIDNTVRRLVDRGNSVVAGVYAISDYLPPVPPVPYIPPDPDACRWEFEAVTGDSLRLPGDQASGADFDPQSNTNDFTIAGRLNPATVVPELQGLFTKGNATVAASCWGVYLYYNFFIFALSKDGTDSGAGVSTRIVGGINTGTDYFFCGRYNYISDGGSYMNLKVNATSDSSNSAVGPIYSSTAADVQIADTDHFVDLFFTGDIYWLAYWNSSITDDEVTAMGNGTTMPWDIPGVTMYINFCKEVALTYETEVGNGPNAPYIFTVSGSPVKH